MLDTVSFLNDFLHSFFRALWVHNVHPKPHTHTHAKVLKNYSSRNEKETIFISSDITKLSKHLASEPHR